MRWVVGMCCAIRHDRDGVVDALEPVPDVRWYLYKAIAVRAQKELQDLALGRRCVAFVVENKLYRPVNAGVVQCHEPMPVPSLDHAGVDGREVDLTKLAEMRIGAF